MLCTWHQVIGNRGDGAVRTVRTKVRMDTEYKDIDLDIDLVEAGVNRHIDLLEAFLAGILEMCDCHYDIFATKGVDMQNLSSIRRGSLRHLRW